MKKRQGRIIGIGILIAAIIACVAIPSWLPASTPLAHATGLAPLPLISSGVPAYSNVALYSPGYADDTNYDTYFRSSSSSGWLAYDLSGVPTSERGNVVLAWYNDFTGDYDWTLGDNAYNEPSSYTIEVNSAAGGTVPTSGWTQVASVTGENYHSRQFVFDMTGDNWVRMNVGAVNGSAPNNDFALNMDIHDASQGHADDWLFLGDSITRDGLTHDSAGGGSFGQLVNAGNSAYYPIDENGGTGGATSATLLADSGNGQSYFDLWLSHFPGQYVSLNFGTNDADEGVSPTTYQANMTTMINAIIAAGKTPVIPTIPWGTASELQTNGPALNSVIASLESEFSQIIAGPDLWSYFQAHPSLISGDGVHPTSAGYTALKQQWATAMLTSVYSGVAPTPTPTNTPTPTPTTCGG